MRGQEYAELRAFAAIVEHGNFARAAGQLRVSPSALSQTIRQLEERLGVRLLNRSTRSVSLTEAGTRLLARVRPALDELAAAVGEVNAFRDTPVGQLRISVPRVAATSLLKPLFGRFHAAYPDIVLELVVDDAVVDLVAEGMDAGIRLGEMLDNDMVAVRLGGTLRQLAVASPAYLATHGTPTTPRDLLRHRCINWRQPGNGALYQWEFQQDGVWFAIAVQGPLVLNERELGVAAAVQGVGIAFWEERQLRPLIEQGLLVPLLESWSLPFEGFYLCYSRQRQRQMAAPLRALIDFLKANVGE